MVDQPVPPLDDRERAVQLVTDCIAQRWPDSKLAEILPLRGDASSRRYLRCRLLSVGAAPSSVIVMLMDGSSVALSSDELGVFGADGPRELPFLNVWRYLSRVTDAVPVIYATAPDGSGLVLEDVGDLTLWDAAQRRPNGESSHTEELFGKALDLLADLQARSTDDGTGCYAFSHAFDRKLFLWEFEHFIEYGLADPEPRTLAACRSELTRLADRLAELPRVFCHRDYHAWNIHVHENRLRVIDFQDALLGPVMYDVASLLTDRHTPELIDTATTAHLIGRFATDAGVADAYDEFSLCAFQRVLKVIGRFNYLADVKGKPAYLDMLPTVVATARDLALDIDGIPATKDLLAASVKAGPSGPDGAPA